MELVILAAGMGSRFGGLKQIEPIDEYNNFIIDYSIHDAIEAGFESVVFIIKEEMLDEFRETIGKRIENKIKTKYAFQKSNNLPNGFTCPSTRKKPWGTAQAILSAKDEIENNFIIINADDYYGKDAFIVAANYLKNLSPNTTRKCANVSYDVVNTLTSNGSVKRGICFKNDNNEIVEILESSIEKNKLGDIIATPIDNPNRKLKLAKNDKVSMNMFIFTKDILQLLEEEFPLFLKSNLENLDSCEFIIATVISNLISKKMVSADLLTTSAKWYGVTYKEDKENVVKSLKQLVDNGTYKKGLW